MEVKSATKQADRNVFLPTERLVFLSSVVLTKVGAFSNTHRVLRISCNRLSLRNARELATYLETMNGIERVGLDLGFTGTQTRTPEMLIEKFDLIVYISIPAARNVLAPSAAKTFSKKLENDVQKAILAWMERHFDSADMHSRVRLLAD